MLKSSLTRSGLLCVGWEGKASKKEAGKIEREKETDQGREKETEGPKCIHTHTCARAHTQLCVLEVVYFCLCLSLQTSASQAAYRLSAD
jgi:hypothetical protein